MLDYSSLITQAMKYVDNLNPKSVDRNRLRNKVNTQIVANIKKIAISEDKVFNEIDKIFNAQLLEELSRYLWFLFY